MEVTLDKSCLPADKQRIKFQISEEELYGKWRIGEYNENEQSVHEDLPKNAQENKTKNIYCLQADVTRWIDESENPPKQWQFTVIGAVNTGEMLRINHNKGLAN